MPSSAYAGCKWGSVNYKTTTKLQFNLLRSLQLEEVDVMYHTLLGTQLSHLVLNLIDYRKNQWRFIPVLFMVCYMLLQF